MAKVEKKYTLKKGQEAFRVVSGLLAGRRFEPEKEYAEIPEAEKNRFREVKPAAEPPTSTTEAKAATSGGGNKS